jgi:hypothetical protein
MESCQYLIYFADFAGSWKNEDRSSQKLSLKAYFTPYSVVVSYRQKYG